MLPYQPRIKNGAILQPMMTVRDIDLLPSHIAVLKALHNSRNATRVELSAITNLSTQSLTRITKQLIDSGLVREGDRLVGARGQPAIRLSICGAALVGIGLVFEYDRITCVARDTYGEELVRLRRHGDFNTADAALDTALHMIQSVLDQMSPTAVVTGIGVSQSGFFYEKGSHALVSRNDPPSWRSLDVREALQDRFKIDVFLENDASAAAVGLAIQGGASNFQSFYSVLMAKGVGGGFVSGRQLVRGHLGNAGELGILFGTGREEWQFRPCEESLLNFLRETWKTTPSHDEIEAAYKEGNRDLETWLANVEETFALPLNAIASLLDPEVIIFTGRLPFCLRQDLAKRMKPLHPQFGGFKAPAPKVIADPNSRCLEAGAASLSLSEFLNGNLGR